MGAADGHIGATTKLVDNGPDSDRWNVVIAGDGYRESELEKYHGHVDSFVERLFATPPFDALKSCINIHRIDVVSAESGADDPADCPDQPASSTGATANTFFDATFCSVGPGNVRLSRLLTVDSARVEQAIEERVPEAHQPLVIVNSMKYGGSGGPVAVCSVNKDAAEIAIHEIGHSAFGLADEYGGQANGAPQDEPRNANVTIKTERATHKWGALIDAATPIPTPLGITPPPGKAGAYEGAFYFDSGVYRPLRDCKMRTLGVTFCPVCAGVIREALARFRPAPAPPSAPSGLAVV